MDKGEIKHLRHLPTRIKDESCRNCGYVFKDDVNFCPRCGQINNIRRISFLDFIKESLGDFFAYDSRMFNSIIPLFTKPGVLSKEYISGKRASHIHPVRLYFIASFLFFFFSSINEWKSEKFNVKIEDDAFINLEGLENIKEDENLYDKIFNVNADSKIDQNLIDSAQINNYKLAQLLLIEQKDSLKLSRDSIFSKYNIESSLKNKFIYSKLENNDKLNWEKILNNYLAKLPIIAFFFLPIFVIFLNIFHFFKDILYFEHIILAFHIQAVLFIMLAVGEVISLIHTEVGETINIFIIIGFSIYLMLALKKFYNYNSWILTIFMWSILNTLYFTLALIVFLISIAVFFAIS